MITTTTEVITPEIAKAYLATSEGNPRYKKQTVTAQHRVEHYASTMRKGNWTNTGEPIIFDAEGHLIDGHHRLSAVIKSKVPCEFQVTRGVNNFAKRYIDSGQARTDAQRMPEYVPDDLRNDFVSSIVRLYNNTRSKRKDISHSKSMDSTEMGDFICENEETLRTAKQICCRWTKKSLSRNAPFMLSVFEALKAGVDPERLMEFSQVINTNLSTGVEAPEAAQITRNMLQEMKGTKYSKKTEEILAVVQTGIYKFANYEHPRNRFTKVYAVYTESNKEMGI